MAVKLFFVRHGEAASSWDKAPDPGLSELGHQQALSVSRKLQAATDPVQIFSSPLCRARETATPLEQAWAIDTAILPQVAEIPSKHIPFQERRAWLEALMKSEWSQQPVTLLNWRSNILDAVRAQQQDAVVFTHFMVINTIVAAAEGTEKIMSFRPDNCSVTCVSVENNEIQLIERGAEAITVVQ